MQEDIVVWNGANPPSVGKTLKWVIGGSVSPDVIIAGLNAVCSELLKPDPSIARAINIQVARYQQETLQWTRNTSQMEFVRDIFYRIDHPRINIYPVGEVSSDSETVFQGAHWL